MCKLLAFLFIFFTNFVYIYGQGCKCTFSVSTKANSEKILQNLVQEDSLLYKKILEFKDLNEFYGISKDNENNIYLIGIFQENWAMVKYSPKGDVLFKVLYNLDIFDNLNAVVIDGDCYIYFAGKIGNEYALLKFDFDGKVLWEKKIEKFEPEEDVKFPVDSPCLASLIYSE